MPKMTSYAPSITSRNKLLEALAEFKSTVVNLAGGYITLSKTGYWQRSLAPGQSYSCKHETGERIVVHSGSVVIYLNNADIHLRQGNSIEIDPHIDHRIEAGPDGAQIEFKYF